MSNKNLSGEFILKTETDDSKKTTHSPIQNAAPKDMPEKEIPTPKNVHPHSNPHFYSAFSYYPKGVRFQDQEIDEEVILLVRQHFITNVPWILSVILLAFLPPVGVFFLPLIPFFSEISTSLLSLSILFYYLALFSLALLYFTIWYFNVGIITNKRLIDIDVHNILVRVLSEARLNSIQDITATQTGGIRSIFNYGDVDVQTEALTQNIEFYRVPKANFIRTLIGNLVVHRK